jgi:hypothetical protein
LQPGKGGTGGIGCGKRKYGLGNSAGILQFFGPWCDPL